VVKCALKILLADNVLERVNARTAFVNVPQVTVVMHVMYMTVKLLQTAKHVVAMDFVMRRERVYAILAGSMRIVPRVFAHWDLAIKYVADVVYVKSPRVFVTMNFLVMLVN
jgi:hypothetical protein